MNALKNATISAQILALMNNGKSLPEAFDAVMGEGSYLKLAGEMYDALKSEK